MSPPPSMESSAPDARSFALELHSLLRDLDRARFRDEMAHALEQRLVALRVRLAAVKDAPLTDAPVRAKLTEVEAAIDGHEAQRFGSMRERWSTWRRRVHPAYESLASSLRETAVDVPSLRPTNHARAFFHVGSAFAGILVAELLTAHMLAIALVCAAIGWTMEISRRQSPFINDLLMKGFGPVAHPHERHRINSATWYVSALVVIALLGNVVAGVAALTVLGVGDPLAATIGRRFGRTPIRKGRSLEGTLAFFVTGTIASIGVLRVFHPELALGASVLVSAAAAALGAVAELFSGRIDDNMSIPISAALAALATLALLGL